MVLHKSQLTILPRCWLSASSKSIFSAATFSQKRTVPPDSSYFSQEALTQPFLQPRVLFCPSADQRGVGLGVSCANVYVCFTIYLPNKIFSLFEMPQCANKVFFISYVFCKPSRAPCHVWSSLETKKYRIWPQPASFLVPCTHLISSGECR